MDSAKTVKSVSEHAGAYLLMTQKKQKNFGLNKLTLTYRGRENEDIYY